MQGESLCAPQRGQIRRLCCEVSCLAAEKDSCARRFDFERENVGYRGRVKDVHGFFVHLVTRRHERSRSLLSIETELLRALSGFDRLVRQEDAEYLVSNLSSKVQKDDDAGLDSELELALGPC